MEQMLIGVDIGGTKTEALLVNGALMPQTQLRQPTTAKQPERLLANLVTTIDMAVAQADVHPESVSGIGIGITKSRCWVFILIPMRQPSLVGGHQ